MADPKIRAKLVTILQKTLEEDGLFSFHDFTIAQEEGPYGSKTRTTTILYQHASDVYLNVVLPKATSGGTILEPSQYHEFRGEHAPGEIDTRESFEAKGLDGFLKVVRKWLFLVKEDLEVGPLARKVNRQQAQINEIVGAFDNLGDEYFTREEAEQLEVRLDELAAKIENAIRANASAEAADADADEKGRLEQRISAFEKDFESLKHQVAALRKQSWLRSFAGKFVMWSSDPANQHLLESGVATVNTLLSRKDQR